MRLSIGIEEEVKAEDFKTGAARVGGGEALAIGGAEGRLKGDEGQRQSLIDGRRCQCDVDPLKNESKCLSFGGGVVRCSCKVIQKLKEQTTHSEPSPRHAPTLKAQWWPQSAICSCRWGKKNHTNKVWSENC